MIISSILLIYICAAVLPAAVLMVYIYNADKVEKEPAYLLWRLVGGGVLAALVAMVLEYIGESVLSGFVDKGSPYYSIFLAFLVVAVAEEGMKLFFLYRRTWRDENFNYKFDGVVYAVFVSLGFAAFENITYVFNYGLSVAPSRALLAIPAHMGFAVFMGTFYGRAKVAEADGRYGAKTANLLFGYVSAIFLHGFYDASAMLQTSAATTAFMIFVVVMYVVVFSLIRHDAKSDMRI
jgi:RsiW-degrading membrane proteinase PrsW (M82 family)